VGGGNNFGESKPKKQKKSNQLGGKSKTKVGRKGKTGKKPGGEREIVEVEDRGGLPWGNGEFKMCGS